MQTARVVPQDLALLADVRARLFAWVRMETRIARSDGHAQNIRWAAA